MRRAGRDIKTSWLARSEKFFEIQIDHDIIPVGDVFAGSEQRMVRTRSRAEASAGRRATLVEPRLQDLQDRLLDQAVGHHRNARLALAAAGLG